MNKTSRVFWGVGFITAAVFLVLSQLNLITAQISIWNVLIGLLCAAMFVSSIAKHSFGGIFFAIGLAWLTFGEMLGLPEIGLWTMVIIVLFLTIGFNFIFPHKHTGNHNNGWEDYDKEDRIGEHQKVKDVEEDGYVECSNTFGALAKYVNSADFKGGRFSNSFGELKIYLDQAHIISGPVEISITNSFGSVELYIPKEWRIVQDINVFAGDVKEKNRNMGIDQNRVNLIGSVSFGEISITYV